MYSTFVIYFQRSHFRAFMVIHWNTTSVSEWRSTTQQCHVPFAEKYKAHNWTHNETCNRWQSNTVIVQAAPNTTISKVYTENFYDNKNNFFTTFRWKRIFWYFRYNTVSIPPVAIVWGSPSYAPIPCSQGHFRGGYRIQVKCVSLYAHVSFMHCLFHLQQ